MSRERVVSSNEKEFILEALTLDLRTDGRRPDASRKVTTAFSDRSGEVEVSLGNTRAIGTVTADITEPRGDRPTEGVLMFNVDVSVMASPAFDRASKASVELARVVERCIKESNAVDLETLCLVAGQKVWGLKVDIRVCNYEGNLVDCCTLAALCALLHFKRRDATVVGNSVTIHSEADRNPIPLTLHHMPISSTFAIFETTEGQKAVVDPSLAEDLTGVAMLTIATNAQKNVCCLHKPGGAAVSHELFNKCLEISTKRTEALTSYIKGCLDEIALKKLQNDRLLTERTGDEEGLPAGFAAGENVPRLPGQRPKQEPNY